MPVRVAADGAAIEAGTPTRLFTAPGLNFAMQGTILAPYMLSRDGRRFLVATARSQTGTAPITLIQSWRNNSR